MLTDGQITLRAPEPADVDCLFRWENDTEQWASASTMAPLSHHQLWEYVNSYDADAFRAGQLRLVVEIEGNAVGVIDITDVDATNRRGFVGIYVAPAWRGRGVAKAALELLCRYAEQTLGLHQLAAITLAENAPARALFTEGGFKPVGKLRSWVRVGRRYFDALLWQRLFPSD